MAALLLAGGGAAVRLSRSDSTGALRFDDERGSRA
jgi:hypothetical protein